MVKLLTLHQASSDTEQEGGRESHSSQLGVGFQGQVPYVRSTDPVGKRGAVLLSREWEE